LTGPSPSAATGTVWSWLSSVLLLNGVAGPDQTGYPVSWSVSVALCGVAALVITTFVLASLSGRTRRTSQDFARPGVIRTPFDPGPRVTGIAITAGLIGAGLLLFSAPEAASTTGSVAISQGLLGLGIGLLSFRLLEGATGTLKAPLPRTAPAPQPMPGLGSVLTLTALVFCVYRSDLMHDLKLLPVFPISGALVYCLAMPHASRSPLNRILDAQLLQWLGTRALGVYLLHGPVQLTVEKVCELRGLDRESTPVGYGVLAAVVLGSLITAELGYRLLESRLAASRTAPVAISMYRRPHSRPERLSRIDQNAIPNELRLKPLPRRAAADDPATEPQIDVAAEAAVSKPTRNPVRKAAASIELPADQPAVTSVELPADQPIDLDDHILDADAKTLDADPKTLDTDAQP
jgi:peptidoglycan/LPS O-acetylase OafA/YrhL